MDWNCDLRIQEMHLLAGGMLFSLFTVWFCISFTNTCEMIDEDVAQIVRPFLINKYSYLTLASKGVLPINSFPENKVLCLHYYDEDKFWVLKGTRKLTSNFSLHTSVCLGTADKFKQTLS